MAQKSKGKLCCSPSKSLGGEGEDTEYAIEWQTGSGSSQAYEQQLQTNRTPSQDMIDQHTHLWASPAQQSKWKLTVGGHNQVNPDSFPVMGTSRALQFPPRLPSHGAEAENRETTLKPIHGRCTDWQLFLLKGLEGVSVGAVVQQEALGKKWKGKAQAFWEGQHLH